MNKLVTIESAGPIKMMGDINGPIKTPCSVSTNVIIDLLNSGKVVYEVNPKNHAEKVRLTRLNVNSNNFPTNNTSKVDSRKQAIKARIRKHEERVQKAIAQKEAAKKETLKQVQTTADVKTTNSSSGSFISNKSSRKKKRR